MISIIIPIYNAEKTISKCIDSVLHQTLSDWELILVDDGSNDKSGQLCDEYASIDKRIQSIHQTNGGPSKARNTGMNVAKGKWITFIDADDWVEFLYLFDFNIHRLKDNIFYIQGATQLENNQEQKIVSQECFSTSWGKLFNSYIIKKNNISFPEDLTCGEDSIFNLKYCKYIEQIEDISVYNYHYTYTPEGNSLSNRNSCQALFNYCKTLITFRDYEYIQDNEYYMNFVDYKIHVKYYNILNRIYKDSKYEHNRIYYMKGLFSDKPLTQKYFQINYKSDKIIKYLLLKKLFILADVILVTMYKLRKK